tara:strand:- start:790 stop:1053 length:264 start_codon:yes stop_codon:yes gene_type:complete
LITYILSNILRNVFVKQKREIFYRNIKQWKITRGNDERKSGNKITERKTRSGAGKIKTVSGLGAGARRGGATLSFNIYNTFYVTIGY